MVRTDRKDFDWLTEESKTFLQRGYLLDGTTAVDRIRYIAEYAERKLGIEGFADKFFNYMAKGYYSLSSPIWANFGLDRGLPISCVTGDTWINTDKGGKRAKDIQLGDMLLTHKGRFRPVTNIIPTKDRSDIWNLRVYNRSSDLFITGDHLVLTNLGWVRVDELDKKVHLVAINSKIEQVVRDKKYTIDLKGYTPYNFILEEGRIKKDFDSSFDNKKLRRRNASDTHVTYYSTPFEKVELDLDLAWFIGLWFAEGSVSRNSKYEPNGIKFTLNQKDERLAKKVMQVANSKFGLNATIREVFARGGKSSWLEVTINSKIIGNLFASFGNGCKNKKLPDWIMNANNDIIYQVFEGILTGDGCLKGDHIDLAMANPDLVLQVYNLALRLNYNVRLNMTGKVKYKNETLPCYSVTIKNFRGDKPTSNVGYQTDDGLIYSKILELYKTDKVEDVYDFTVDEDHSFSCAGVVVHNCFGSYIPDSIEGILYTHAEVGTMSKHGGGTSAYFGDIRPRGSAIKDNGKSDGSFTFAKLFDTVIDVISQGTSRKGQFAGYIDIEHGDIEEWLDIHKEGNPIQLMLYGVVVGREWLESMKAGDPYKRQIWAKVLQSKSETGIPYILFRDNANEGKPDVYKDKNLNIKNSNLCLAGDTYVAVTDSRGRLRIEKIVDLLEHFKQGENFTILSYNEKTSKVEFNKVENVFLTKHDKTITLNFESGNKIKCTRDHKFLTKTDGWVEAQYLKDKLVKSENRYDRVLGFSEDDEIIPVYDLTVDKVHNFFVYSNELARSGVLAHNCIEIMLPVQEDESFVCCLSSMNLLHFDEWKDTDAVETLTYFLDVVMSEFIDKADNIQFMERPVKFAKRHRALGIGVLGWHSYLQSKMIPFDSFEAMEETKRVFKFINQRAYSASEKLAEMFGEPEILKGYGRRNTTLIAIAPTKSSSFILGQVSPSIEPFKSNYYIKDLAKIKTVYKNPFLEKLLQEKGLDTEEIWESILLYNGSVQHLEGLTDHEKDVFKTFEEISQLAIIQQAALRQRYIDQGQSLNISIHPSTSTKDLNKLYLTAEELGIKGIYYQYSQSASQALNRSLLTCSSCEA